MPIFHASNQPTVRNWCGRTSGLLYALWQCVFVMFNPIYSMCGFMIYKYRSIFGSSKNIRYVWHTRNSRAQIANARLISRAVELIGRPLKILIKILGRALEMLTRVLELLNQAFNILIRALVKLSLCLRCTTVNISVQLHDH